MDVAIKNISDAIKKQAEAVSEVSEALLKGDMPEQSAFSLEKSRMNSIEQMQSLVLELTRLYTAPADVGEQSDE